jgi:GGDEF domain-containing protein
VVGACESFDERPFSLPRAALVQLQDPSEFSDDVTGLPARQAILRHIQIELKEFRGSHIPFGVLCLGIDDPDRLRAADGAIGLNQILYATGRTLAANIGPENFAGRWSDRKFVAVLRSCKGESLLESAIFLKRLAGLEAVPWWGDRLTTTLSVAGTMARDEDTAETIMARAEAALDEGMQTEENRAVLV